MPDPINPHPNTPTVCISMISPPRVRRPALPERQAEAFASCRCTFKASHHEKHEITQRDPFSLLVCFVRFVGFVCVFRAFRAFVCFVCLSCVSCSRVVVPGLGPLRAYRARD